MTRASVAALESGLTRLHKFENFLVYNEENLLKMVVLLTPENLKRFNKAMKTHNVLATDYIDLLNNAQSFSGKPNARLLFQEDALNRWPAERLLEVHHFVDEICESLGLEPI